MLLGVFVLDSQGRRGYPQITFLPFLRCNEKLLWGRDDNKWIGGVGGYILAEIKSCSYMKHFRSQGYAESSHVSRGYEDCASYK